MRRPGPYGIEIVHPDSFLTSVLVGDTRPVISALECETAAFERPPLSVSEFLATLTTTVPTFANLAADAAADPPGPKSPVPALVMADEEEGIAAFGEPGDITNPAQVAFAWWTGLLGNLELAQNLTTTQAPGVTMEKPLRTWSTDLWLPKCSELSTLLNGLPSCASSRRSARHPKCSNLMSQA